MAPGHSAEPLVTLTRTDRPSRSASLRTNRKNTALTLLGRTILFAVVGLVGWLLGSIAGPAVGLALNAVLGKLDPAATDSVGFVLGVFGGIAGAVGAVAWVGWRMGRTPPNQ